MSPSPVPRKHSSRSVWSFGLALGLTLVCLVLLRGAWPAVVSSGPAPAAFIADTLTLDTTNTDTKLVRDAANTLAQKNGTANQEFRVYSTTTGPVYGSLLNDTAFRIESFATGTTSSMVIGTGSGNNDSLFFLTNGISRLKITSGGDLIPISTGATALGAASLGYKQLYIDYTNTATVGNVTINKAAGRVNLAAAGTSLTVTDSLVTAASHIFLNADGAPGNAVAVQLYAVPGAGSFTVNAVPAVTNQTAIDFFVVNSD